MKKGQQAFSRESKLEAVRLLEEGKKPAAELVQGTGVEEGNNWDGSLYLEEIFKNGHPLILKIAAKCAGSVFFVCMAKK